MKYETSYGRVLSVELNVARGCGFRTIGSTYLVTDEGQSFGCDRLPMAIVECPCCGERPQFSRGIQLFNFAKLYGEHPKSRCSEYPNRCFICEPNETSNHYLMWVGKDYATKEEFIKEAHKMGISKKLPLIPEGLVVGESWIILGRKQGGEEKVGETAKGDTVWNDEIFYAFQPTAIEQLVSQQQADDEEFIQDLLDRGITPSVVLKKDEDLHRKAKPSKEVLEQYFGEEEKLVD